MDSHVVTINESSAREFGSNPMFRRSCAMVNEICSEIFFVSGEPHFPFPPPPHPGPFPRFIPLKEATISRRVVRSRLSYFGYSKTLDIPSPPRLQRISHLAVHSDPFAPAPPSQQISELLFCVSVSERLRRPGIGNLHILQVKLRSMHVCFLSALISPLFYSSSRSDSLLFVPVTSFTLKANNPMSLQPMASLSPLMGFKGLEVVGFSSPCMMADKSPSKPIVRNHGALAGS